MDKPRNMSSRVAALLSVVMLLWCGAAAAVQGRAVQYGDGLTGFLATPEGDGNFPSVVLIHEWWGLNDDIREKAAEFARAGYNALAVDLYGGESTDDPGVARSLAGSVRADVQGAFANLRAAIDYLKGLEGADARRVASVGWCFGGGWSYQIAKNNLGTKASVIYYGPFNPEDDLDQMRATILGHFAENDRVIKLSDVRQLQATLSTLAGEHEVFIYPNASHGFANPYNEGAFDKEAAQAAWARTIAFLEAHLK